MREGQDYLAPKDTTEIKSPGDYPHLFVRVHVYDDADCDEPEYRAAAMVGHLGFPVHHAKPCQ